MIHMSYCSLSYYHQACFSETDENSSSVAPDKILSKAYLADKLATFRTEVRVPQYTYIVLLFLSIQALLTKHHARECFEE